MSMGWSKAFQESSSILGSQDPSKGSMLFQLDRAITDNHKGLGLQNVCELCVGGVIHQVQVFQDQSLPLRELLDVVFKGAGFCWSWGSVEG